jgi:hypothetical protein
MSDNNKAFRGEPIHATHGYRPDRVQNALTRTYQPQGEVQVPTSVSNLVSGVSPAAQPVQSQPSAPASQATTTSQSNTQNGNVGGG